MRAAWALAFAALAAAQDQRFDVESRLVLVPATVTDRDGRPVEDLQGPDFLLLDDGRPQPIEVDTFTTGLAPIALVVAVQSAGISTAALSTVRKIGAMIQPLITGEHGCAAIVSFDEEVRWRQEFTGNPDALARAFDQLQPGVGKQARMLDAVHESIVRLRSRPNARRVLLLISESRDRGSEADLESAVLAAQTDSVVVYALTYSAFKTALVSKPGDNPPVRKEKGPPLPGREAEMPKSDLERPPVPPPEQRVDILGGLAELMRLDMENTARTLTASTGGTVFSFTRLKGLEKAIGKLGDELHTQYVLSFVPEDPAPGYHRLEVRLRGPGELRIRARPGYWSTGDLP